MSSPRTPCAACKTLRRKCTADCPFALYFPPEQPYKFEVVHKVYGASTVARILSEVDPAERAEAVHSLVYEAEARVKDPIYGCVGAVSILQNKLKQVQTRLDSAKEELASYIGPSAMMQALNRRFMPPFQNQQPMVVPVVVSSNSEQMLSGAEEQDMLRNLEQQKQYYQQQLQQQQLEQYQLILQQQKQQQQPQQAQHHPHPQQLIPLQLLFKKQNQPNQGSGNEEGKGKGPLC